MKALSLLVASATSVIMLVGCQPGRSQCASSAPCIDIVPGIDQITAVSKNTQIVPGQTVNVPYTVDFHSLPLNTPIRWVKEGARALSNPDANVIFQDDIITVRGETTPFVVGNDRKTSLQVSMSSDAAVAVGTTMNVAVRITRSDITSDYLVLAQTYVTLTIAP